KVECKCSLKEVLILKLRDVDDEEQCARYSGSTIKLLGSAAESFGEAAGQCKPTQANARDSCAALVPSAVTGLGFLIENMARTSRECTRPRSKYLFPNDVRQAYGCGQEVGRLGTSVDTIARAIAGSVINC
ncbi:unnamed protein product, partial [Polarella glacialis]